MENSLQQETTEIHPSIKNLEQFHIEAMMEEKTFLHLHHTHRIRLQNIVYVTINKTQSIISTSGTPTYIPSYVNCP